MSELPYGIIIMTIDAYRPIEPNHYHLYHFIDGKPKELTSDIVDDINILSIYKNVMATIDCGKYGDEIKIFIKQNVEHDELDKNNPGLTDMLQSIKDDSSGFKTIIVKKNAKIEDYTNDKLKVLGLDYLRKPLTNDFNFSKMSNPITEKDFWDNVNIIFDPAIINIKTVYFFGDIFFDSSPSDPDCINGIHNIHFNQNNTGRFIYENRVNGDGAVIIDNGNDKYDLLLIKFVKQTE